MLSLLRYFCFILFIAIFSTVSFAQETAQYLAQKIENSLTGSAGISMQFGIAGQGKVTIIINNASNEVRIESPSILMVSNGKTIWNYNKKEDQITIDNISSNSPFMQPHDLFMFSKSYSSRIISNKGNDYELELIPNNEIAATLKAAGGIEKFELTLHLTNGKVKIIKATATSPSGIASVTGLSIKPLATKAINKFDFNFKPKASTKVTDLRE